MWERLCLVGFVAGCYSAHAPSGAPCMPLLDNCPAGQTCSLVTGTYVCVEGAIGDGGTVDSPGSPFDARATDGAVDAPLGPWSLVQTAQTTNGTLALAASGSGHLLVVAVETTRNGTVATVTDNAANTYVAVPNGRATDTVFNRGVELWYVAGSKAGATSITIAGANVFAAVGWEVANIRTTNPLDSATTLSDQAATTMPVGASITTTAPGELVISTAVMANVCGGIHAGNPFTNDRTANGNGWAHLTSNTAPAATYQAAWDQNTAGEYCSVTAAFFAVP